MASPYLILDYVQAFFHVFLHLFLIGRQTGQNKGVESNR